MGPTVNMHQMGVSFHCFSMEHIKIEEEVFLLALQNSVVGGVGVCPRRVTVCEIDFLMFPAQKIVPSKLHMIVRERG